MLKNLKDKKVLLRVDFNVPLDENCQITDDTRIRKSLPTIKAILDQGASVILLSHLGRPLTKLKKDGKINVNRFTLENIVDHLSGLLGREVKFSSETIEAEAFDKALSLQPGEVLLLENTRFNKGETQGDREMGAKLAQLGDVYINDAFGTAHRYHASTAVVAEYFRKEDKSFGLLMEEEMRNADKLLESPQRPFTAILGGAKVSDKIQLIERLMDFADNILIGGAMSYTFIKAKGGEVAESKVENTQLDLATDLLAHAKERNVDLYLPRDSAIADEFDENARRDVSDSDSIPLGWMGLDIGPEAITQYSRVIEESKTILWNGPMGVFEFEKFSQGTMAIARAVAKATTNGAFSLVGGGDSVAALNKSGVAENISFISTGGGALLEYLEGKKLPGVFAIEKEYLEYLEP